MRSEIAEVTLTDAMGAQRGAIEDRVAARIQQILDTYKSGVQIQGVDLTLGHSKYIKAIRYAKVKTDAVDAATLAQLLRSALIPAAHAWA